MMIDPLIATVIFLPIGAALIFGRRIVLHRYPLVGRISVAMLAPLVALVASVFMLAESFPTVSGFNLVAITRTISKPPDTPQWTAEQKKAAFKVVRATIRDKKISQQVKDMLNDADVGEGVSISFYSPRGIRSRGIGKGSGNALESLVKATTLAKYATPRFPEGAVPFFTDWSKIPEPAIQIDVLGKSRRFQRRPLLHLLSPTQRRIRGFGQLGPMHDLVYEVEPGIDGLEIAVGKKNTIVLPADPITEGWLTPAVGSVAGKIRRILLAAWQKDAGEQFDFEAPALIRKFRSSSFAEVVTNGVRRSVNLRRGNRTLPQDLSKTQLISGLGRAANWLSRQATKDGVFKYEVFPPKSRETNRYAIARHSGALYALVEFYNRTAKIAELKNNRTFAMKASLDILEGLEAMITSPDRSNASGPLCLVDKNGRMPSGATALAAIAIARLPHPSEIENKEIARRLMAIPSTRWMDGMSACIRQAVDAKGAVFREYAQAVEQKLVKEEPRFFPGEVALALAHLHERTGDPLALEVVVRITQRQLDLNDQALDANETTRGDHWMIQALVKTSHILKDDRRARLAVLMARDYLGEQYTEAPLPYPDYLGGYDMSDIPETNSLASRCEAIGQAIRAADRLGDHSNDLRESLRYGAWHLLNQQLDPTNSFFSSEDLDLDGAVRMSMVDNHCRIDNNQHSIIALLNALELSVYDSRINLKQ